MLKENQVVDIEKVRFLVNFPDELHSLYMKNDEYIDDIEDKFLLSVNTFVDCHDSTEGLYALKRVLEINNKHIKHADEYYFINEDGIEDIDFIKKHNESDERYRCSIKVVEVIEKAIGNAKNITANNIISLLKEDGTIDDIETYQKLYKDYKFISYCHIGEKGFDGGIVEKLKIMKNCYNVD